MSHRKNKKASVSKTGISKKNGTVKIPGLSRAVPYLLALLAFFFICMCGPSTVKVLALICLPVVLVTVAVKRRKAAEHIKLPLICLALIVLMDGISTLYAASPKFALNEFLRVLAAFCFALFLLYYTPGDARTSSRSIAAILARATAAASIISIDMLSTHWISGAALNVIGIFSDDYQALGDVEAGVRMTSIFENPNIFAGCAGIGVLLSLGLVLSSQNGRERSSHLVCLYANCLAFVLVFSMGASAMMVLAFIAYLLLEYSRRRAELFILMVEALFTTMISVALIAMTSLQDWSGFQPIPLACLVIGSAALCFLDRFVGVRLSRKLSGHGRALAAVIIATAAAAAVFVVAAFNLTGGVSLPGGGSLRRSIYPQPGEYAVSLQAEGDMHVVIESQDRQETMMHTGTVLYEGELSSAVFTVPEGSTVVYFNISAPDGAVIRALDYHSGSCSGSVPLGYKLLPGFIANRLQGLFANQNAIQRVVFFEDGLKLFALSPVIGRGMGAYENGIQSVQSFYYQTKYAHNHYIQVLCETGVIGLVLFLALLVVSAVSVVRSRRRDTHPLVPALGAALVFMAGHGAVEVVFSAYVYLPLAFSVFALINLCCGDRLPLPCLTPKLKERLMAVYCVPAALFFFLLCGNVIAVRQVEALPTFDSLETACAIDRFQWTDHALSYVSSAVNASDDPAVMKKSAKYAARLERMDSNIIPYYLADYYFTFSQPEKGFEMIKKYVSYVSSNPATWQQAFDLLEIYNTDDDYYRGGVEEVLDMMHAWNGENMGNITLSESNLAYLSRLGMI